MVQLDTEQILRYKIIDLTTNISFQSKLLLCDETGNKMVEATENSFKYVVLTLSEHLNPFSNRKLVGNNAFYTVITGSFTNSNNTMTSFINDPLR